MQVLGFERLSSALDEEIGSAWIIPSRHFAEDLAEYKALIEKAEFDPPAFDDGETAEDQVRRKTAPRKKAVYDDEDDDIDNMLDDGDEELFPANLKPSKLVGPGHDRPAKKRRLRRKADSGDDGDLPTEEEDEIRAEKAQRRRKRDLEKQRKIKSALYVSPSDDESDAEADAEFFAREEAVRQRVKKALQDAPTDVSQLQEAKVTPQGIADTIKRLMGDSDADDGESDAAGSPRRSQSSSRSRKRKSDALDGNDQQSSPPVSGRHVAKPKKTRGGFLADSSDDEDDDMNDAEPSSPAGRVDTAGEQDDDSDSDHMETDDTTLSSNPKDLSKEARGDQRSPLKEKVANILANQDDDDGEDDDVPVVSKRRPRARGGFAMDSSDEE